MTITNKIDWDEVKFTMFELARLQARIYIEMVGDGVPSKVALELIKNQLSTLFNARLSPDLAARDKNDDHHPTPN